MLTSAYHAFSGLFWIAPRTPSLKLAAVVIPALIGLGVVLGFSPGEIALVILSGTILAATETINSAIELLCDRLHPRPDEAIGRVKDVAAGATALCEIGTGAMLLVILAAHVLRWLGH